MTSFTSERAPARYAGARAQKTGRAVPKVRRTDWKAYLYILPAWLIFLLFLGIPVLQGAWYSLWNYNGLTTATWAGLGNYAEILADSKLRASFGHAGVLIFFYSVLPVVLALFLTAILSRGARLRGMSIFRTVLFLPQVVASVVVATTWVAIYSPDGLLNQVLRLLGLQAVTRVWLGDFSTALPAVGLVGTWLEIGLCLVLFLSGVAGIPTELYEAVRLDGAGFLRELFTVTLPALRGHVAVALTLTIVAALKTFDLVYVTTRGGPGFATTVPAFEAYDRAFNLNEVGAGSAIAMVLTGVILVVTIVVSKLQPKDVE